MLGVRARAISVSLALLALSGSIVLVGRVQAAAVDALAQRAVSALLTVTAPLDVTTASAVAEGPSVAPPPVVETQVAAVKQQAARRGKRAPAAAQPRGLFVSAATVLALAKSKAEPRGTFVGESEQHPAGLRLSGVAALGIGAEEGDILIEALGVVPRSSGQVIGAIIEARARRARFLTGTLWRRGQTLPVTVEQPYEGPA